MKTKLFWNTDKLLNTVLSTEHGSKMVVQLFIAGLLVSVCAATSIKFPEKDPCILIDFESNNSLSWTPENGTVMAIPNWNISESRFSVTGGNCTTNPPYVVITFHDDNATLRFDFNNASDEVEIRMTLKVVPEIAFKDFNNTDKSPMEIKVDLKAGSTKKAYKCNAQQSVSGKKMVGNDTYDITYRIKNMKAQGYGVENGTYSKDIEECQADNPTTAPPNTTVTTAPETTEPSSPTKPTSTSKPPENAPKVTLKATDKNTTCAIMQGAFTFTIPYNKTKGEGKATVVIPKDVSATGNCMNENKTDVLMAQFGDGWQMDFVFKGDGDNIWLDQLNMTVVYDKEHFPDIAPGKIGSNATFSANFNKAFKAKQVGSYLCDSDTTTDLVSGIQMKTKEFQYTALQNNVTSFSDKNVAECSADAKTSSIVPIAVGAALAGLVVIVLIAYLIGRRRNRKGYESV